MGRHDRPEHSAPPEIFYNEDEARKYTDNTRMIAIQTALTERALELLALPQDGSPKLLLDLGCGSGLSGEALTENGRVWVVSIAASVPVASVPEGTTHQVKQSEQQRQAEHTFKGELHSSLVFTC